MVAKAGIIFRSQHSRGIDTATAVEEEHFASFQKKNP